MKFLFSIFFLFVAVICYPPHEQGLPLIEFLRYALVYPDLEITKNGIDRFFEYTSCDGVKHSKYDFLSNELIPMLEAAHNLYKWVSWAGGERYSTKTEVGDNDYFFVGAVEDGKVTLLRAFCDRTRYDNQQARLNKAHVLPTDGPEEEDNSN